jgi:hypothetical protein
VAPPAASRRAASLGSRVAGRPARAPGWTRCTCVGEGGAVIPPHPTALLEQLDTDNPYELDALVVESESAALIWLGRGLAGDVRVAGGLRPHLGAAAAQRTSLQASPSGLQYVVSQAAQAVLCTNRLTPARPSAGRSARACRRGGGRAGCCAVDGRGSPAGGLAVPAGQMITGHATK